MIEVTFNNEKMRALEAAYGLSEPITVTLVKAPNPDFPTRGTASPRHITITYGLGSQAADRLRFVQSQIVRTLLHEFRHQWQFKNWTEEEWERDRRHAYQIRPCEVDARDFADRELANWRGLVRVRRRCVRGSLHGLAAAERTVRQ